jgi:N-hydroxyarylamine O-acetyltransferase
VDAAQIDAYLARIGAARPERADLPALRALQERQLLSVPFENLSIHLGEPIELTEAALFEKLVGRRRGGFCYELNGGFAALLTALDYRVTLLAARVHTPVGLGPPFDHLALRIDLDEPWLVDVGFGSLSRQPLRLDLDTAALQTDADGRFQIVALPDGDLDVMLNDQPQYRLEPRPRALADFTPTCWWQQTSPRSHFTQTLVCSLPTAHGRVTLSGRRLVRTRGTARDEQLLTSDAEVLAAYRTEFGIELQRVPRIAPS